jgi:hypothetical protein
MTIGTHTIRAAVLVFALAGCSSAAAQVPATDPANSQRASDVYFTAGDGLAEGPAATTPRVQLAGGTVGDPVGSAALVP